ncbi:MAG: hypothetical protein ACI9N3_001308, partial [Colwellia sp.]
MDYTIMSRYANLYKSPLYLISIIVLLFLMGSTIIGWNSHNKVEKTLKAQAIATLKISVQASHHLLKNVWIKSTFATIKSWSTLTTITKQIKQVVIEQSTGDLISLDKATRQLTSLLDPYLFTKGNEGYYIISPEYKNITAKLTHLVGQRNVIADEYSSKIAKAFNGQIVFIPPVLSAIP